MSTPDQNLAPSNYNLRECLREVENRLERVADSDSSVREVEEALVDLQRLLDDARGAPSNGALQTRDTNAPADLSLPQLGCKTTIGPSSEILPVGPGSHGMFIRTVIESFAYPFLVINAADYTIRTANAAARACGPSDVTTCHALTHHRDTPCEGKDDPCPLVQVRETGKSMIVEHVHYTKDGEPRNIEVHAHPMFDEDGNVTQIIEYSIDVTERKQAEELVEKTRDLTVFAMAKLTESRDPETGEHLERMRSYSMLLAEYLAVEGPYTDQIDKGFLADLYRASPLHDIGKVGIPDVVLLKPGRLNDREFAVMKQHTIIGAEALESACQEDAGRSFLTMSAEVARSHHERFDGSGYPDGLVGDEIPLAARIVALADVYDALTSVRVYKPAFEAETARLMINGEVGTHFDPAVVEAFHACWEALLAVRRGHADSADSN